MFPMGSAYIAVVDLANTMSMLSEPLATSVYECIECDYTVNARSEISCFAELQRLALNIQHSGTVVGIIGRLLSMKSCKLCSKCDGKMLKNTYLNKSPQLLILHLPYTEVKISQKLKFGQDTLHLQGVVYYGSHHYTSRVIDDHKNVWFHDGMTTGSGTHLQGSAVKVRPKYFNKGNGKSVALLVYAQLK
jgi:hypothetical protein